MFPLPAYRGQTVGVLGLGPEGLAVADALVESGANVLAFDSRGGQGAHPDVVMQRPALWPVDDMAAVIIADGARRGLAQEIVGRAEAAMVPVLTEIDLFALGLDASDPQDRPAVIAVTGAAGKSVTVSIIAHVLKELGRDVAVAGELGSPLMSLPPPKRTMTYVMEMPVRRLAMARRFRPDIAIALSVAGNLEADQIQLALRSLLKVFKSQGAEDRAIIGVDDPLGQELCTMLRGGRCPSAGVGTIVPVSGEASLGHGIFALGGMAYSVHKRKTQNLGDFSRAPAFVGPHLNQDAAAAIAACLSLDIPPSMIVKALHSYQGLKGRFECIGSLGSVMFIDDSFASSSAAAKRAIGACPDVFWIGGDAQATDGSGVSGSLSSLQGAYLVGPKGKGKLAAGTKRHASLTEAFEAALRDAQRLASSDHGAAPVILYSPGVPAAASGIDPNEFRSVVQARIDGETKYA